MGMMRMMEEKANYWAFKKTLSHYTQVLNKGTFSWKTLHKRNFRKTDSSWPMYHVTLQLKKKNSLK